MTTTLCGGCACGAVRYECTSEPVLSVLCHCRDCQRATGSAFAAELGVLEAQFAFVKGEPRYFAAVGDSGSMVWRGFCADCGSPLVARSSGRPGFLAIQAASLDDPSVFSPAYHVYVSRAQPWDRIDAERSAFARIPDAEQLVSCLAGRNVATKCDAVVAIMDMLRNEPCVTASGAEALLGTFGALGLLSIDEHDRLRFPTGSVESSR